MQTIIKYRNKYLIENLWNLKEKIDIKNIWEKETFFRFVKII